MILGRVLAYQRPFRRRVATDGLVVVAPLSAAYALVTLVVLVAAPRRLEGRRVVGHLVLQ